MFHRLSVICRSNLGSNRKHVILHYSNLLAFDHQSNEEKQFERRRYLNTKIKTHPINIKKVDENSIDREHTKVSLHELLYLLEPEKKKLSVAVATILLSVGVSLTLPTILGNVIDILQDPVPETVYASLKSNGLLMLGICGMGGISTFISTYLLEFVGKKIGIDLRKQLFKNIIVQDLKFFDQNSTGEIASRLSHDVHEVAEHLVENISKLLTSTINLTVSAAMILYISPHLSVITLGCVPIVALGGDRYALYAKKLSKQLLNKLASSTQLATERLGSIRLVRLFTSEQIEQNRYGKLLDESLSVAKQLSIVEGTYLGSIYFISNASLLIVMFLGANQVMDSVMTTGSLASYCVYASNLNSSIEGSAEGIAGIAKAQGSAGRLYSLLEKSDSGDIEKIKNDKSIFNGPIEFKEIEFAYPTRPNNKILSNFNLKINSKELFGITGPSGCGKSSIGNLLTGLYQPSRGSVFIGGYDINDIEPNWLRKNCKMVTQEPIIFLTSLRENISYGTDDASIEEIEKVARITNIHDFIVNLKDGYDTKVAEGGFSLSGGQKQRIALARALLSKPSILVMDEATSGLDNATQNDLMKKLLDFMKGSTIIMVGHQRQHLKDVDRLAFLDHNGKVHSILKGTEWDSQFVFSEREVLS